jgi:hypothetical protein
MLVTLVAVLCNGLQIVTTGDRSGITMMACQVHAQIGIVERLANGRYREWKLRPALTSWLHPDTALAHSSDVLAGARPHPVI